jgi:hypothetical protein
MPRSLILAAIFVSSACAAMWPDRLGEYQRKSATTSTGVIWPGIALWVEYGQDGIETGDYGPFAATAFRFKDVTGAYAASLDPSAKGAIRVGNYLVSCQGKCPKNLADLADAGLPRVAHGSLPTLGSHFPSQSLLPHSERYIIGPVGLAANAREVPAAAVNFDFGTEGQIARYKTSAGTVLLGVFSFPAPSMARQQLPQFQKISGATAKRIGPLIAVAIGPAAVSSKILGNVNYEGVVATNERPPEKPLELKPESAGKMVLAILSLAGLLLGFCLLSGLVVGGTLRLARRFGYTDAEGSLITLHLEGK